MPANVGTVTTDRTGATRRGDTMTAQDLDGTTALVTGAGSGSVKQSPVSSAGVAQA